MKNELARRDVVLAEVGVIEYRLRNPISCERQIEKRATYVDGGAGKRLGAGLVADRAFLNAKLKASQTRPRPQKINAALAGNAVDDRTSL